MPRSFSPQSRFLVRASAIFVVLLGVWWWVLRAPLLEWARLSTDVVLNAAPGATVKSGVTIRSDGVWVVQAPVRVSGVWRNVRVETGERLPTQLSVGLPLFWAILLARGRGARGWWIWPAGTALLLAIPPAGLLLYAAHVVQLYVFPGAPAVVKALLASADYVASTVAPYLAPVLAALLFDAELRRAVLDPDGSPVKTRV